MLIDFLGLFCAGLSCVCYSFYSSFRCHAHLREFSLLGNLCCVLFDSPFQNDGYLER